MLPTECKMPDLSDLDFPLKKYLLLHAFVGDKGLTQKEGLYRRNFVRLVDKTIKEYQEARSAIILQIQEMQRPPEKMSKEGRIIHILAFTDHFETCINAISRLLKQLERMKSKNGNLIIPRLTSRIIEAYTKSIADIRNVTEHMAEAIQKDELENGQPVMIMVGGNGDRAVLASYEIKFTEIAIAIRRLHELAMHLFDTNAT